MSEEQKSFDLESVYDELIYPRMAEIIKICNEHGMPMFATFLYLNNLEDEQDGACTTFVMPENRPIPEKFLDLRNFAKRPQPLRLRVKSEDGKTIEETVIFP